MKDNNTAANLVRQIFERESSAIFIFLREEFCFRKIFGTVSTESH